MHCRGGASTLPLHKKTGRRQNRNKAGGALPLPYNMLYSFVTPEQKAADPKVSGFCMIRKIKFAIICKRHSGIMGDWQIPSKGRPFFFRLS